jgi:hypothetical protein
VLALTVSFLIRLEIRKLRQEQKEAEKYMEEYENLDIPEFVD